MPIKFMKVIMFEKWRSTTGLRWKLIDLVLDYFDTEIGGAVEDPERPTLNQFAAALLREIIVSVERGDHIMEKARVHVCFFYSRYCETLQKLSWLPKSAVDPNKAKILKVKNFTKKIFIYKKNAPSLRRNWDPFCYT